MQKRKPLRLKNFNYNLEHLYHVTICTHNKKDLFIGSNVNQHIINCLFETKDELSFYIYAYCLMPNHIHLICSPKKEIGLPEFIKYFKGRVAALFRQFGNQEKLWQRSFYDHITKKGRRLTQHSYVYFK